MLVTTETRPLTPEQLEQELLKAVAPFRFEDTRLARLFERPDVPRKALRNFAAGIYSSANSFLGVLSQLAENAPDPVSRLFLLENLMEEEGVIFKPSSGLAIRPEQRHVALARRFVVACDLDPDELTAEAAFMQKSGGRVQEYLAAGQWMEAVAYMLVGQELKAGEACATLVRQLGRHGFSARELAFFEVHIEADMDHGRQAIEIVLRNATDAESQAAAIRAAEEGARDWFASYGGAPRTRH